METKPLTFRRPGEAFGIPDIPEIFLIHAQELSHYLNGPDTLILKLEAVYRLMDEIAPFIASFTSCSKGCSHCCQFDVQLTTFEAEYIYLKTGVPHRSSGSLTTGHSTACPFLTDASECGIYQVRPLACRTYHVLGDPAICADPAAEQIQYGTEGCGFGNIIYKELIGWVHFQTAHLNGKLRDIRDFFPHSRQAVQSHLRRVSG